MDKPATWYVRASGLGALMSKGRGKELWGATSNAMILEAVLYNKYGIEKSIQSKYLDKGIINEPQALRMLAKYLKLDIDPNEIWKERMFNDYLTGEPDLMIRDQNLLADVKCSYNATTFPWTSDLSDLKKHNKNYWFQMQAYMFLSGIHKSVLAYCLTDTPPHMINDEAQRRSYKAMVYPENADKGMDLIEDEIREQVTKEMTFNQIPDAKRIRVFEVEYDPQAIDEIIERVKEARTQYNAIFNTI